MRLIDLARPFAAGICLAIKFASASVIGLDQGFGLFDGRARTDVTSASNGASAMARMQDGRLVLAGSCQGLNNYDFCVVRFTLAGLLDPSFKSTGKVLTDVGSGDDVANALVIKGNGTVTVAGRCNSNGQSFCLVRYTESGELDTTFNSNGKVLTRLGDGVQEEATAIFADDYARVVASGYCSVGGDRAFCLARYNYDGTLDESFNPSAAPGERGKKRFRPADDALSYAAVLLPDGRMLQVGSCRNGLNAHHMCVVRYLPDGDVDTSFNGTGVFIGPSDVATTTVANAVAVQSNGAIVLAGTCTVSPGVESMCLERITADGALDTTLGGAGNVVFSGYPSMGSAVAIQPDGRIVIAGHIRIDSDSDFFSVRINADGSADGEYNRQGVVTTKVTNGNDVARSIAILPTGEIVLGGSCGAVGFSFCAVRYSIPCTMDLDGDGAVLATTDALIYARIALGIRGDAVTQGINFPSIATRNTWFAIRNHLYGQCGMPLPP